MRMSACVSEELWWSGTRVGYLAKPPEDVPQLCHVPLAEVRFPFRLRLLSLVASHSDSEACVCDLVGAFDLAQPTISHHLKILRDAGLVKSTRRGNWVYYPLDPRCHQRVHARDQPANEAQDGVTHAARLATAPRSTQSSG